MQFERALFYTATQIISEGIQSTDHLVVFMYKPLFIAGVKDCGFPLLAIVPDRVDVVNGSQGYGIEPFG